MALSVAEPELELRCPDPWTDRCSAGRLLAKLRLSGQRPSYVHPDNLIELECQDCKVRMRKTGRPVIRVLHRFDFAGEPAGTLIVEKDQRGLPPPGGRTRSMNRDWRDDAACQGMDTEMFFPVSAYPKGADLRRVRRAQAVCEGCPVRLDCLEFAARTGQRGIWGGLTEEQRRYSRLCKSIRAEALAG